ncbi:hypothetical protein M1P56_22845 [Streptomyces sp. HU2014]|uniref:Uncharacterized protein n=1 Tax=Streptomyces albireticuli TaxID=1940 RepID=A0A1Z2KXR2_9ACTN|nr:MULTISPECIES: hypothetical protein [Streptomyces]ARZ66819.1 hypothetical protein SMD11_1156 [Streptomyces albireticuli]UQI46986.1 hypothetical protein M1P56_22845 [Streptomyces sp. HU2014]
MPADALTAERAPALVCRVRTEPDGDDHTIPYVLRFTVTAPRTVAVGEEFTVLLAPAPLTFNPRISSGIRDTTLRFHAPTAARDVRFALEGGDGTPYAEPLPGGGLAVRSPGPFAAGVPFTLPALRWTLRADGSGAVETGLAGSGLTDPAWSYRWSRTRDARHGTVTGYPDPAGTLSRTVPVR